MAKSQHNQRKKTFYFFNTMNVSSSKSDKIVLSKLTFYIKNRRIFFSLRNINFLLNTFFLTSIFEPLHFLKSCPMFNDLPFIVFTKCWPQILLFRNPKVQLQTSKYVSNGYLKVIKMLIPIRSRFCFSANSFPKRSILMLIRSSISRTA